MPRVYPTFEERFWGKIKRRSDEDCWLWTGSIANTGYGRIRMGKHNRYAHRVSYEYHVAPIPDGMHLDHLCETKACVNPAHLEPVTSRENVRRSRELWAA